MRRLILTWWALVLVPLFCLALLGLLVRDIWRRQRDRRAVLTNAPSDGAREWYQQTERDGLAKLAEIEHVPGRSDAEVVENLLRRIHA